MSLGKYHVEIGFGQRNGHSSCINRGVNWQIVIFDNVFLQKAMLVPIFLPVGVFLISVTIL